MRWIEAKQKVPYYITKVLNNNTNFDQRNYKLLHQYFHSNFNLKKMFSVFQDDSLLLNDENIAELVSTPESSSNNSHPPTIGSSSQIITGRVAPPTDAERTENLPPSVMQALRQGRIGQREPRQFGSILSSSESQHHVSASTTIGSMRNNTPVKKDEVLVEEDNHSSPFDKYWNVQLPSFPSNTHALPSSSNTPQNQSSSNSIFKSTNNTSHQQVNNTTSVTTTGEDSPLEHHSKTPHVLKSPMASHLLSPSVRKAISSNYIMSTENDDNETTGQLNSMLTPAPNKGGDNFSQYIHNTFGTSTKKRKSHLGM